jgi:hypothetical protein
VETTPHPALLCEATRSHKGEGKKGAARSIVVRGLDPRIDLLREKKLSCGMDCRVKPGNDG